VADVSKLVSYAVLQGGAENASKLVSYAVLQGGAENASKLVSFAVLAPLSIALTGRIATQSQTRGTVGIGVAPALAGRIRFHATGALASPLPLAGRASAVGRATGSIGVSLPVPLAGRIRVSLQGHPADVAFGIALGGRITFAARAHPELRILIPLPPTPLVAPPSRPAFQVYEIPMTAGAPQFQVIRLSGVRYQIAAHWCDPLGVWVLDIADLDGHAIVSGIPMITGADLLAQYAYLNFGGLLLAQSDFDWTVPPTFDTLGRFGHLYWIPTPPPVVPPPRYPLSPEDPRNAPLPTESPPVPS
jgi:hypothetical protein